MWASILPERDFCDGESLSAWMLAPDGMMLRREDSAAERRHPSSRSRGSKSAERRPHKSRQAQKLAPHNRQGVLSSRPSPKPSSRDTKRSQAPIVIRKGAPNQVTKGRPNVAVSIKMDIRSDSTARIEDLGPPGARAEQTESALSVRELADGGQEGPGLCNAPAQQILTPTRRPQRSPKKFEIGGPNPNATLKIARSK